MTCPDCIERIDDLHEGRLSPLDIAAMRQHIEACAACRAWVSDIDRIRTAARMLGPIEPPAGVWARVAAAVDTAASVQPAVDRAMDWRQWMAAAASVALVVWSLGWIGSKLVPAPADYAVAGVNPVGPFQLAEAAYQDAIDSLEPIAAEADAPALTEPALVTVQATLDALDQAIGEARERLTQEPDDELSQDLLLSALESKVSLLQDTVALLDEGMTTGVNQ